jgi:hypothetical protein
MQSPSFFYHLPFEKPEAEQLEVTHGPADLRRQISLFN